MNTTSTRDINEWFSDEIQSREIQSEESESQRSEVSNDAENLLDEIFSADEAENGNDNIERVESDVDISQSAYQTEVFLEYIKTDFKRETKNNRILKWVTVIVMMLILIISIIFLGAFMWNLGIEKLKINDATLNIFITGVFVEVVMLVKIILESIFPKNERELYLKFIENANSR